MYCKCTNNHILHPYTTRIWGFHSRKTPVNREELKGALNGAKNRIKPVMCTTNIYHPSREDLMPQIRSSPLSFSNWPRSLSFSDRVLKNVVPWHEKTLVSEGRNYEGREWKERQFVWNARIQVSEILVTCKIGLKPRVVGNCAKIVLRIELEYPYGT